MNIELPIIDDRLKVILKEFEDALATRNEFDLGFNVFSLVSDTYYKENFHSQIIHTLLNVEAKHEEKKLFFDLFLDFLQIAYFPPIDKSHYINGLLVENEFGINGQRRIDILIQSKTHAIIIENKIYDAADMDNQLIDYYKYCKGKKLDVDAILYLSIDGIKSPDENKWNIKDVELFQEIRNKIKNIAAFDIESKPSLFKWLDKCKNQTSNEDARFIIKHYQQLLKHLRKYIMEKNCLKKYYEQLIEAKNIKDIKTWIKIHNTLILYYPDKLIEELRAFNNENKLFNESKVWDKTAVIFSNICGSPSHYLKVIFQDNEHCFLSIMTNDRNWIHDAQLNGNNEFVNLFIKEKHAWVFRKNDYNLIGEFDNITNDVKNILRFFSNTINPDSIKCPNEPTFLATS